MDALVLRENKGRYLKTKYYGDFIVKKIHNYPMGKPKKSNDKKIYHYKKLSELKHLSS